MKKIFTLLMLMLTAMVAKADSYPIFVKGIQVTDENSDNILGDDNKSVRYIKQNNALTFCNANITYDAAVVKVTEGEMPRATFFIEFEGTNTLTSNSSHCIIYDNSKVDNIYIRSRKDSPNNSVTINAKKSGYCGIDILSKAYTEIVRLTMTVNAGSTAIGTQLAPKGEWLRFTGSNVNLHGDKSAVKFSNVYLEDAEYVNGYAIDGINSDGRGTYNGTVKQDIKVRPKDFGIEVSGIKVTGMNCNYILGDNNETVKYSSWNNTLTLNNATLTTTSLNAIFVNNESDKEFYLKLVGTNKITHSGRGNALLLSPTNLDKPVIVYSEDLKGKLEVTSSEEAAALYCGSNRISIKDCSVNVKNTNKNGVAFRGNINNNTVYNFNYCTFNAETAGSNVCNNIKDIEFTNSYMQTPTDGFINSNHNLSSSGARNKLAIVPGKDIINPNFYYGDEITVSKITAYDARIDFMIAMDNTTPYDKLKYHIYVAKDKITGLWEQNYDLNVPFYSNTYNTTLTDLQPNTKYVVRLKVTDEAGNYATYKDLEFTTKQNAQPTPPANKTITCKAGARSIDVKWNAATDDWTPADKLLYIVEYKAKGASGWQRPEVGNATSYTITGLQPNTTYLVDICVKDQSGLYNRYQETEVKTLTDTDAVETITTDAVENAKIYNLQGVEVGAEYKGIVIINGKKQILK